jgi:hypothetical protein
MTKLTGSEKQIAWAEKIKDDATKKIEFFRTTKNYNTEKCLERKNKMESDYNYIMTETDAGKIINYTQNSFDYSL